MERGTKGKIILIGMLALTLYNTYYFIAITENRIYLYENGWPTDCQGSVFPFPIDHGRYNACGLTITPMTGSDRLIFQLYVRPFLYVAAMTLSWFLLGIIVRRVIIDQRKSKLTEKTEVSDR